MTEDAAEPGRYRGRSSVINSKGGDRVERHLGTISSRRAGVIHLLEGAIHHFDLETFYSVPIAYAPKPDEVKNRDQSYGGDRNRDACCPSQWVPVHKQRGKQTSTFPA
jgi:hypothetical protein